MTNKKFEEKDLLDRRALKRVVTTYAASLASGAMFLVGGLLLYAAHQLQEAEFVTWAAIVRELGAILAAASALHMLWDLFVKRKFQEELWSYVNLSSNVAQAGIVSISLVSSDFVGEFEWKRFFEGNRRFFFFFAYAETWRHTCETLLHRVARDPDSEVAVALPDPQTARVVEELSSAFDTTSEQVKERIASAKSELEGIFKRHNKTIDVFFVPLVPHHSFYCFDKSLVLAFNKHQRDRGNVITVEANDQGWLWGWVQREIATLKDKRVASDN